MEKILYTGGTFDIFHYGHVNLLRQCSMIADKVIVSLNSDEFIKEYKGEYPILRYNERAQSVSECKYVDKVIKNTGGMDSRPAILESKANIVAIGTDWATRDYYAQMNFDQQWLDTNGIVLVYLPDSRHLISTSDIRSRMEKHYKNYLNVGDENEGL